MRVGTQGLFRPYLNTFVPPFLPTRLTAPGSLRMTVFELEKFLEVSFFCLTEIRSCFFLRSHPQIVLLQLMIDVVIFKLT